MNNYSRNGVHVDRIDQARREICVRIFRYFEDRLGEIHTHAWIEREMAHMLPVFFGPVDNLLKSLEEFLCSRASNYSGDVPLKTWLEQELLYWKDPITQMNVGTKRIVKEPEQKKSVPKSPPKRSQKSFLSKQKYRYDHPDIKSPKSR